VGAVHLVGDAVIAASGSVLPRAAPDAIVRTERYLLLARALRYPSDDGALEKALSLHVDGPAETSDLARALLSHIDDRLAGEHNRLFSQAVAVPPHETGYVVADKGTTLGQLAWLCEVWGVRAGGAEHETPDHIGTELELMALLCLQEAMAEEPPNPATPREQDSETSRAERFAMARRAQELLLTEHLGRFAPKFCERLAHATRHPYFQQLATALQGIVEEDLRANGWAVAAAPLPIVDAEEESPIECPVGHPSERL
jgi:TorA maturation chaperone TorD